MFLFELQLKSFELKPLTLQSYSATTVHMDMDTGQLVQNTLNCLSGRSGVGKERELKAKEGSSLSVLRERWFLEDCPEARQRV